MSGLSTGFPSHSSLDRVSSLSTGGTDVATALANVAHVLVC